VAAKQAQIISPPPLCLKVCMRCLCLTLDWTCLDVHFLEDCQRFWKFSTCEYHKEVLKLTVNQLIKYLWLAPPFTLNSYEAVRVFLQVGLVFVQQVMTQFDKSPSFHARHPVLILKSLESRGLISFSHDCLWCFDNFITAKLMSGFCFVEPKQDD